MIPLQTADQLLSGKVWGFILDALTTVVPTPLVALLVFGSIGVGYFMVQKSPIIPVIMFLLIGGVTIAEAPAVYQQGIVAAIVLVVAGIRYRTLQKVRV